MPAAATEWSPVSTTAGSGSVIASEIGVVTWSLLLESMNPILPEETANYCTPYPSPRHVHKCRNATGTRRTGRAGTCELRSAQLRGRGQRDRQPGWTVAGLVESLVD